MRKMTSEELIASHKENVKRYYNSEKGKEAKRRYAEAHKEKTKEYQREYRQAHKKEANEYGRKAYPRYKEDKRAYQRALTKKYKDTFLEMYGGCCTCCGEAIQDFLTIEHKQGQEKISRRTGLVAYRDAIQEYRPDLYEVLCWNCNCAKGHLGYCPHHPPETIQPYKIHRSDKPYNYTKEVDSLGRRYKHANSTNQREMG